MNRRSTSNVLAAIAILVISIGTALAQTPASGSQAPAFRLQDQEGRWHELKDYRGKWVVLYFYPKDQTPSSTDQAGEIRDNIQAFRDLNAVVLGVSVDDVESHRKFSDRNKLAFTILADPTKATVTRYGVLKGYPGAGDLARRDTFLIDPEGRIARHFPNVDPKGHSEAMLREIRQLQQKPE